MQVERAVEDSEVAGLATSAKVAGARNGPGLGGNPGPSTLMRARCVGWAEHIRNQIEYEKP